ncbi:TPA: hypothetical protein ACSVBD_004041 [Salmonella enterica subsp. enterica]
MTDKVVVALEKDIAFWRTERQLSGSALQVKVSTGQPYSGINIILYSILCWR